MLMVFKTKFRRRREGKTNYTRRLRSLKSRKPRLVARIGLNSVTVQVNTFEAKGDKTMVSAVSTELRKLGWSGHCGNCPAAYLTGLLCGTRARKAGIKEVILDIGLHTPVPGSNVYAALKGAVDAGLSIPHEAKVLPSEERITGKRIEEHSKKQLNFSVVKQKLLSG